ncbi:hypothetical protein [Streptomyces venezuelae]|uniref:hypothetical protein n=1 Tax=Streptomyces venezuelae TaxID=54571 RepID=UPI00344A9D4B
MRPAIRRAAAAATATTVLLGGIALSASPASASPAGAGSCTKNIKDRTLHAPNLTWPAVHERAGAKYKVVAYVESAEAFRAKCTAKSKAGNLWYYGYVESGPGYGKRGWVYSGNF